MRRAPVSIAALLIVVLATGSAVATELGPGGTFVDDDGGTHEPDIEAIAAEKITLGCNPPVRDRFCPDDPVTRGQMAAFLTRALGYTDGLGDDRFVDDDGSTFEDDIDRLAAAGVTYGCNPPVRDRFCPDDPVTRGQMAAFLTRALGYTDGLGDDRFVDDDGSTFEDDIDRLAAAGVTHGCNPPVRDRFCPDDPVTRAQMASFLTRALGLTPRLPPPRCPILPPDNIWNTRVDGLPVHHRSAEYVATIGSAATLHPDFGSGEWPPGSAAPIGIPYVEVDDTQPWVAVRWTAYGSESDPGPYPIPADAPIEGGPAGTGDRHVIVLDRIACTLYELFDAVPEGDGSWAAASGAVFDLRSNDLRPAGWTSADAAGLPIFPGLVRYDEVASGRIDHAIRFTAPVTARSYVWPARHQAGSTDSLSAPPMGQRFRLRNDFDVAGYSAEVRVILTAMREYGLVLADNGSSWFVSGAPDPRWDNDVLRELKTVPGSAFEAVDVSGLMVAPDSGAAG